MFWLRCFSEYNILEKNPLAVAGHSLIEEVIEMYITLSELLTLGVFVIELITLIL